MKKFLLVIISTLMFISCVGSPVEDSDLGLMRKICIEGHVYYTSHSNSFAIKLNDDGTPCKCESK